MFVIRRFLVSEYVRDTQSSEYARVCSWIMLEYVYICLKPRKFKKEPKISAQAK